MEKRLNIRENRIGMKMTEPAAENKTRTQKPAWLRAKLPTGEKFKQVRDVVNENRLHTICQSGSCPNMGDCWTAGTASFMILGNTCTRACKFCAVSTGRPDPIDWDEAERVADAIFKMGVKHAVVTSVDRDELKDCGSIFWAYTIKTIKQKNQKLTLETLIPDFKGIEENIQRIVDEAPDVVSHNQETVRRLCRNVRPQSSYDRSLGVIRYLKNHGMRTKSGIMLGLGEETDEVLETMRDLKENGCDVITIGQYLQPTKKHLPVERFVTPEEFRFFRDEGYKMGLDYVESGPMVRSSYHSEKQVIPGFGISKWREEQERKGNL